MPTSSTTNPDGTVTFSSTGTFGVTGTAPTTVTSPSDIVLPVLSNGGVGMGRLIHPIFGALDYETKPDEWVNLRGNVVVPPVWAYTRTMGGAANVLWRGFVRDVVTQERWKAIGGLSMPITQLQALILFWTNPPDPQVDGYVEWYPTYETDEAYKVILLNVSCGQEGIVLDDVVNAKDGNGNPYGWVTNPVVVSFRIVDPL